ncbi:acetyl-CoA acetyltransferase domain protein [Mycobacterium xenopi 3993]|nr:acetyl-CoA acetyltransferase domain protein [Mycobacterium xenopi 3993]
MDDPARPLTVTGGLTFAGGPWSNYVTHSIATMAELLVANPGRRGLITANGGYLTKHSFGVYGTDPPNTEFRWEDVQPVIDQEPTRRAVVEWEGVGTVESWTTPFDREGQPEKVFLAVRTPDESRTLAVIADPEAAEATVREDIAGPRWPCTSMAPRRCGSGHCSLADVCVKSVTRSRAACLLSR